MTFEDTYADTRDGLRLRVKHWPATAARGVVVLTHGHGEHSGRYHHVAQALCAAGFAAYAYDLRGHGRSGGLRGHVPSYAAYLDDLQQVFHLAGERYPGLKRFLYGHSLGGQITIKFALDRRPEAAGVVLSAPWLRLVYSPPAWRVAAARALARVWPTFAQPTGLDKAVILAGDAEHAASMPELELTHTLMSARLAMEALDAAADCLTRAGEFTWPVLLLHGEADAAVDPDGSREFYAKAASRDKTLYLYPNVYHEAHNDTQRERVLADMVRWLDERA